MIAERSMFVGTFLASTGLVTGLELRDPEGIGCGRVELRFEAASAGAACCFSRMERLDLDLSFVICGAWTCGSDCGWFWHVELRDPEGIGCGRVEMRFEAASAGSTCCFSRMERLDLDLSFVICGAWTCGSDCGWFWHMELRDPEGIGCGRVELRFEAASAGSTCCFSRMERLDLDFSFVICGAWTCGSNFD